MVEQGATPGGRNERHAATDLDAQAPAPASAAGATELPGLVANASYTTWGWVHLLAGAVAIAAGVGLLSGQMWARVLGVLIAALSAMLNFLFIPAYPVWSLLMVTFDIVVIWAITAHGAEMKTVRALGNS